MDDSTLSGRMRAQAWLPAFAAVFLALLGYGASVGYGFVFDDLKTIVHNPLLGGSDFWGALFSERYYLHSGETSYRPLVTISYHINHLLHGRQPWGYHLANVLLHTLNTLLVFGVAKALFSARRRARPDDPHAPAIWAGVAAAIFAVHPAGSEAVNAVSFREDLMATTFVLGGWLALWRFLEARWWLWLALGAIAFLAGLLSKEIAIVLPGLFLLGAIYRNREAWTAVAALICLAAVAAVWWGIWGVWMAYEGPASPPWLGGSPVAAAFNVPLVYALHLKTLLWPVGLQVDFPFQALRPFSPAAIAGVMLFLAVAAGVAWLVWKRAPGGFGVAWIIIALGPVSNLIPLFNPVADRFLYLPLAGFAIFCSELARVLTNGLSRRASPRTAQQVMAGAGGVLILALLFLTQIASVKWATDEQLWTATLEQNPRSWRAMYRLGDLALERARQYTNETPRQAALRREELSYAQQMLEQSVALAPGFTDARNALGSSLMMQGRIAESIEIFQEVLRQNPNHASAAINLCQAHALSDPPRFDLALEYLERAEGLEFPVPEDFAQWIRQGTVARGVEEP